MEATDRSGDKSALVVSYSIIESDPRVRRQVRWLEQAGFTVDTLGLGPTKSEGVRDHFALKPEKPWVKGYLGALLTGVLLPHKFAFRTAVISRIPPVALERISRGDYDLLVLNENEFLPLLSFKGIVGGSAERTRVHLDLHEKHRPDRRRDTFGGRLMSRYYRWIYRHIKHPRIDSRTVVNEPIGNLYVDELGIPMPTPVRNIPPYQDLQPTTVDPENIKMLFHGMASKQRGFEEILEAMETLPEKFTMTFMIMPNAAMHAWLEGEIAKHPARDRIQIVPPAPMTQIPQWINDYDLEIIYYRPIGDNLAYALPNKFFESMQGRLGIVVADGKTMAPEVREWGNGVVVQGYDGRALREALAGLNTTDIEDFKVASHRVAPKVNAEAEASSFLRATGIHSE